MLVAWGSVGTALGLHTSRDGVQWRGSGVGGELGQCMGCVGGCVEVAWERRAAEWGRSVGDGRAAWGLRGSDV